MSLITIICNHILSYDKLSTSSWYIYSFETKTLEILNSEEVYLSRNYSNGIKLYYFKNVDILRNEN